MIVWLCQFLECAHRNRIWLASLGAAAAINAILFWLAGLAPTGIFQNRHAKPPAATPIELIFRRKSPLPPDLNAIARAEPQSFKMPPRFRARRLSLPSQSLVPTDVTLPPPRIRLSIGVCDPADDDQMKRPDCAPASQWSRADRDAAELLGAKAQGYTLDEVAVARGWIKPKPRTSQDAMAAETDATLPQSIFSDPPFPPHAIERTGGH